MTDNKSSYRSGDGRASGGSAAPEEDLSGKFLDPRGDPRLAKLLQVFRVAASYGEPAPSNAVLGIRVGVSKAYVSRLVKQAEDAGVIVVTRRTTGSRVVSAPDGSWSTK